VFYDPPLFVFRRVVRPPLAIMTRLKEASTAPSDELTRQLTAEVQSAREELRAVCDAVDELRESIERITRGYRQDDWQPVQRPIVSLAVDPCDPQFARKINAVDPDNLPEDLPESVRLAVAARLRASQRPGGPEFRAEPPRRDDNGSDKLLPIVSRRGQQALWDESGERDHDQAVNPAINAGANATPQKGTELADPESPRPATRDAAVRSDGDAGPGEPSEVPRQVGEIAAGGAYTLDDWIKFRDCCLDGVVEAAALQTEFVRMKAGRPYFIETLVNTKSADQLRLMAMQRGILEARRHTKRENAAALYRACLSAFTLGDSVSYQSLHETYEEAVERIVLSITDEQTAAERERVQKRQDEKAKTLSNPETLFEFATFSRERGLDELTDEQFARWDALHADRVREDRKRRKQRETVEQFESDEVADLEFRITEGFHDREEIPLWIVQLSTRVERETFQELKIKATQLGGWWSSFKKDAAGFQFRSRASAEKFAGLTGGDADRSEELLARKLRKLGSAGERLFAVAESLETKATEVLEADDTKLKNTARRADMAASMRARAYRDQADAKTLRSIATALAAGDAKYLDGVWNAAQVRSLETILRQARRERIRERLREEEVKQRSHGWSHRYEELEGEPLAAADARYAVYPTPYLYRGHLEQALAQLATKPGLKQITAKMRKIVAAAPKGQDFVEFNQARQVELLEDFLGRAKAAGLKVWWFDHCLDAYKRLRSAQIDDAHELRSALRELIPHLAAEAADHPVKRAEDELRGKDLPGFFPTPRPVIELMLERAAIEPTHRVLEPSCGKGDILDAVRGARPDVTLTAIEWNLTLQGVLTAKGYDEIVSFGDFLEHQGQYDRIVMNPPFENGQDMTHVRHAYDLLAPGGRVVSVMCEGPFFREDGSSKAFCSWLDDVGAGFAQLPEDAFSGVEAFRQTSVRTRLVVIDKPSQ
jgi:hypothetical protein